MSGTMLGKSRSALGMLQTQAEATLYFVFEMCNSSFAEYTDKWSIEMLKCMRSKSLFLCLAFSICGCLKHDMNCSIFGFRYMVDMFEIADDAIYGSVLCGKKARRARQEMVNT